jgi:hypothetical protein
LTKKNLNFFFFFKFREIFFKFFLAITVPHPIWSMPAKIWGG